MQCFTSHRYIFKLKAALIFRILLAYVKQKFQTNASWVSNASVCLVFLEFWRRVSKRELKTCNWSEQLSFNQSHSVRKSTTVAAQQNRTLLEKAGVQDTHSTLLYHSIESIARVKECDRIFVCFCFLNLVFWQKIYLFLTRRK